MDQHNYLCAHDSLCSLRWKGWDLPSSRTSANIIICQQCSGNENRIYKASWDIGSELTYHPCHDILSKQITRPSQFQGSGENTSTFNGRIYKEIWGHWQSITSHYKGRNWGKDKPNKYGTVTQLTSGEAAFKRLKPEPILLAMKQHNCKVGLNR